MSSELDWDHVYQQDVMVVDDSRSFRQLVSALLSHVGFQSVYCAGGCDEAVALYKSKKIELPFLDIDMPEKDGLETLKELIEVNQKAYVVMLTGHNTEGYIDKARKEGARAFIPKPFSADKIKMILEDYARQQKIFRR